MLPSNLSNFNFLFSFFSARLKVAQGQERHRVKELSYDYVSDGKDSIDGKWVVRKPSWRSQEADRIRNIVVILIIFLLDSKSTKDGYKK